MITGFPSPAQGYEDKVIDLNKLLIQHPSATVFMQISTSRYSKIGIYDGDILIIDRSRSINQNSLVVYESDGHFALGYVFNIKTESIITGSVVHVIHTVKSVKIENFVG